MAGFATDRLQKPVELSIDLRVQHALRDELVAGAREIQGEGRRRHHLDVNTGEIVAMVSLPDYDPNNPARRNDRPASTASPSASIEMGSTFKALTIAMALDSGKVNLNSTFDAREPLRYGKFTHQRLSRASTAC